MVRTVYFVLRTLPAFASLDPIALTEGDRWNFVRPRLRAEVHMLLLDLLHLLLDLLHLLRIGLLSPGCRSSPGALLAGCRN